MEEVEIRLFESKVILNDIEKFFFPFKKTFIKRINFACPIKMLSESTNRILKAFE
jgi:hypothetical protein